MEKKEIEKKIQEIFFILKSKTSDLHQGLFSGQAGVLLFLYNYYKYTKEEEAFSVFQDSLNQLIEEIPSFDNLFFSNGLSGTAWFLNFLYKEDVVSSELLEIVKGLDDFIEKNLDVNHSVSDFMHGALGSAFYFIQRGNLAFAEKILKVLFENAQEGDDLYWVSKMYNEDNSTRETINLSLAHGSAAIIVILSKFLNKQTTLKNNDFREKLLEIFNFLQHLKSKGPLDIYPGHCSFNENGGIEGVYSRLSWCYGEMGIGLAFWQTGCSLEDAAYKEEAIKIYRQTLDRRSLEEIGVDDAGLCHGTAGIAHMYNRMYYNTKLPEFRESANYWMEQTLKMAKFEDGLAGYKSWYSPDWINEYGLLGGVAGIGLSLLSHINEECASWDECLLLS